MRRVALLVVVAATLAGCGTYRWEKPGAGEADFRRDSDACLQQPQGQWESCMKARGWQLSSGWF